MINNKRSPFPITRLKKILPKTPLIKKAIFGGLIYGCWISLFYSPLHSRAHTVPDQIDKVMRRVLQMEFEKKRNGDLSYIEEIYIGRALKKEKIMITIWGSGGYARFLKQIYQNADMVILHTEKEKNDFIVTIVLRRNNRPLKCEKYVFRIVDRYVFIHDIQPAIMIKEVERILKELYPNVDEKTKSNAQRRINDFFEIMERRQAETFYRLLKTVKLSDISELLKIQDNKKKN